MEKMSCEVCGEDLYIAPKDIRRMCPYCGNVMVEIKTEEDL